MRTRPVVLIIAATATLAAAGALWWIYASRDALVKQAIESYGPEITGVTVTVKGVKLEPAQGKGAISGLEVGNPAGYKSPRAFTLGEMRLAIDFSTVTSNVIHLKEVMIDAPTITYERGPGGDNLGAIQKHMESITGAPDKAKSSSGKKFIIDNLYVRNARVQYGESVSLPMPDLHLRDVGKKSNGASAGEIVKEVWTSLAHGATGLASRAVEGVQEGAKSALDGLRGLIK